MKTIATLFALPALAFALAGPAHAADNAGSASSDNPQGSSSGYKYDRSMNSGGAAGGSTQTRDTLKAQQQQRQKGDSSSNGYQYDRSMNSGGRAGGSTVPRNAPAQ